MADAFVRCAEQFSGFSGYVVLGLMACLENLIPPIPGDTVTVFGGYLAGTGRLNLYGVMAATTAGSFAGFMLLFAAGRLLGKKYFYERDRFFFSKKHMRTAAAWFARYGYTVVLCNRFLSGVRSVIALCAGITGLGTLRVACCSLLSCLVWNALLVISGSAAGENREIIASVLRKYNTALVCLMAAAAVFLIIKARRSSRAA